MNAIIPLVLGLGLLLHGSGKADDTDCASLWEKLRDRQHPRQQSQAALLLVQSRAPAAADLVRRGMLETESPEVFGALASALRLCRDARFTEELFAALSSSRPLVRQEAAECLAVFADPSVIRRLQSLAEDENVALSVRQTALWTLGRCGRKVAVVILLDQLSSKHELLRQTAAESLAELTGQSASQDIERWRVWWEGHKSLTESAWLAERLVLQISKSRRLEGELDKTRAQLVRLHQQLYARLPIADRMGHIQALAEHEDPAVRSLAVAWCVELLPASPPSSAEGGVGQRALNDVLLGLSRDSAVEVQRQAVLALGRVNDGQAFDRLRVLLKKARPPVRAAAARALAQQVNSPKAEASADVRARQLQVVPALQKALEDTDLQVVIEAAEGLGSLGLPEAAPVLSCLLRHPSEPVRLTAAQSLERVAELSILDALLAALDDSAVTVRFSVIGGIGHAAGNGRALNESTRTKICARLEDLLARDTDPGVRSRSATVLGEVGSPAVLPALWKRVQATEDARVQDKAWSAMIDIIARSANADLLNQWDQTLVEQKQTERRLQLLSGILETWKKTPETKALLGPVTETLIQTQLGLGKWSAAAPLVRELLAQPGSDADMTRRLRWLLTIGELAVKEGNRAEAVRIVQDAQQFLARVPSLSAEFEKLEKKAKQ